jgi:predicted RNA-binding protein with RPS1 domain
MENEDRPEPPVADATEPTTDESPETAETTESEPASESEPREAGRRRPSAEVEFELERLFTLAVKYPEVGPSLAALCFKAGWKHFAERVVQSGVAGGPRGVEYFQIAVQSARRDGRAGDVVGIVRDAVTEIGSRETLGPNEGARLLQLVRQGFSTLLFDLKDPRADLGFVSFLAERWGELEGRLSDDPLFHVLRAQLLWYADPAAAEAAWADAAERGDPELVWNARGTWAKDAERDIGAAEKAYRTGIDRAPHSALLLHNLAQLLMDRAEGLTPPEGETELSAAQQKARNRDLQYADELLRRALRGDARGVRRHIHATLDRLTAMRPNRERPARGPQREARGPHQEAREPRAPREPRAADTPAEPPPPPPPLPNAGDVVQGKVVSVTEFGVFVQLGGHVGLLHRTELAHERVDNPAERVTVGETIEVKVLAVGETDEGGKRRISLSRKALLPAPERPAQAPRGPRGPGGPPGAGHHDRGRGPGGGPRGPGGGPRGPRREGDAEGPTGGGGPQRENREPQGPRPEGGPPRENRENRGPRPDGGPPRENRENRGPRPDGPDGGPQRENRENRGPRPEKSGGAPSQGQGQERFGATLGEALLQRLKELEAANKK